MTTNAAWTINSNFQWGNLQELNPLANWFHNHTTNQTTNVVVINSTIENFNRAETTLLADVKAHNPTDLSTVETYLNAIVSDIATEQLGYAAPLVTDEFALAGYLQSIATNYAHNYAPAVNHLEATINAFGVA